MANPYMIEDAFACVGRLWGAEQAEGDDQGVAQVEQLTQILRDFKSHEDQERQAQKLQKMNIDLECLLPVECVPCDVY
jgi:hypothetical protein